MELFQLRYAAAVAEYRNFSRAAESLFVTQPTLSQQIQRLEQELGFFLFSRNSRQVTLTPEGQRFLESAANVLRQFEALQEEVRNIQNEQSYQITFGTCPVSSPFISGAIPRFLTDFPQAHLSLYEAYEEELIDLVVKGQLDLALISLPEHHIRRKALRIVPVQEEYVCAVLTQDHPLAARSEVALKDLLDQHLVFSSIKSGLRKTVLEAFSEKGLTPLETIELSSIEARAELITDGAVGVTYSGQKTWHRQKGIVRLPIIPHIWATFSIILPQGKQISPALKDLIQIVAVKKTGQKSFTPLPGDLPLD